MTIVSMRLAGGDDGGVIFSPKARPISGKLMPVCWRARYMATERARGMIFSRREPGWPEDCRGNVRRRRR